ncbi:PREDICTED: uncharacterized protein LOC105965953 [Erythranthe guttata]|nr:PREDICTED: uncharacterized protein LOC105965953 [Erythranthe guttata]|eukprot:XP_012845952.1 PREDICTED: uncharacterized protein LOC105965953 [Erythranthe guttata]
MDNSNEEFEPLFDYTRIQPYSVVCLDDDSQDESPVFFPKKRRISDPQVQSTLKALRLKRQELASFAQSAEEMVRAVEESVRKDLDAALQSSPKSVAKEPVEPPPSDREKLVISIQDKDGLKQFRVYMDDKFERLFKMYADRIKVDTKNLVFCFDGDKINPAATPNSLEMEENDIIEVHVKST